MLTEVVREPLIVENPHAAGFSLLVSLMKDEGALGPLLLQQKLFASQ